MEEHVNFLFSTFGSHERAAESLGYTTRHYRKIRKKIEQGEEIPQRIEELIRMKALEMQNGKSMAKSRN